jgi:hypothetical protein
MSMNLSTRWLAACILLAAGGFSSAARAQYLHPAEITATQSTTLPYSESGKITVEFGQEYYFGTATFVHRYTGLTAGHLLYDPKAGFATSPSFQPALYDDEPLGQQVGFFAVLAGYQDAANVNPDSDPAFSFDMGYFVLLTPSPLDQWAAFSADPGLLTLPNNFLALGYAAQRLSGNGLAFIQTNAPYVEDLPGLYESEAYYTESGMSGGPVYLTENGGMVIGAVNVAGDNPPNPAESAARAITPDVTPLLIDAEYLHGAIVGAVITGPASVKAGTTTIYRAGLTFADGKTEGEGIPHRYDEIELVAKVGSRRQVTITKFKPERFDVKFAASLRAGTRIDLQIFRDDEALTAQKPLQTFTVTIR